MPRLRPPEIEKLLERAAISERPSRRLGWSTSARGLIPEPESRTITLEAVGIGMGLDVERARLAAVGVDDDVHAGLGDDGLQVGDPRLVHADLLGQPGERVADDRDVLGPRWKGDRQPGGRVAFGGYVWHLQRSPPEAFPRGTRA